MLQVNSTIIFHHWPYLYFLFLIAIISSELEILREQLAKKDEQIERQNELLFDIFRQSTDTRTAAQLRGVWKDTPGNK